MTVSYDANPARILRRHGVDASPMENAMRPLAAMLFCLMLTPAFATEPIVLRDMGSFHVGGRIVEISGRPVQEIVRAPGGPPSRLDPNGRCGMAAG